MDEKTRKEYHAVVLGALLHDIGKFMQRAEVELCEVSRGMEETLCPVYEGRHSHKHVLWTDHFFEKVISLPAGLNGSQVGKLAAMHHRPDSGLTEIITTADRLSSGMDRDSERKDEDAGKEAYKRVRLRPVFESIELDSPAPADVHRYEIAAMGDIHVTFPRKQADLRPTEGESLVSAYRALWDLFEAEVRGLDAAAFGPLYSSLCQLLQKYTWCIPSSTVDYPDISLFDHMRTTAAIASCLYQYHAPTFDERAVRDQEAQKFTLVVGDLSGIQNYIFNITHIGAGGSAKRLRARSFTVTLIAEIVTQRFMREFGLTESNVLMASGGKFYLLLPALPDTEERITSIERSMSDWLHSHLNAEIGLNLATIKFAGKDFKVFNSVLRELNGRLQGKKLRPFVNILESGGGWSDRFILTHVDFGEEEKLCKGCGRFPGQENEEGKHFCVYCDQDKRMGQKLPRTKFVAFYDQEDAGEFMLAGHSFDLLEYPRDAAGTPYQVMSMGEWRSDGRVPVTFRQTARYIPLISEDDCRRCNCGEKDEAQPGNPMMFQCIAQKSKGRPVLGYLKADVDRLGEVFAFGLKGHTNSVSRIATMSRMLDLFFSGYVEELIRTKYSHIYTVYSGGDDLLLIGPWNMIIEFAVEMEKKFKEFTCNNPNITLSAGIILAKHRMPVFRSVGMADSALEEAKEKPVGKGRNQVWLFGDLVKWANLDNVLKDATQLSEWITDKKSLSSGFVRNLLMYGRMKSSFGRTGKTDHLRYLPLMTYDIARNISPVKREERQWAEGLKDPNSPAMEHMEIIANYALTANRGGGDER